MLTRKRLMGLFVVAAIVLTVSGTVLTATAAPVEQQAGLTVQMAGSLSEGAIVYSITLTNNSSSEIRDIYVTGSIPSGGTFVSATATPSGATFKAVEGGAAAWISSSIPAGGKQGPFSYKVSFARAPVGPAHAWVHAATPDITVVGTDVTWDDIVAASAPRRGCLACHVLVDKSTGKYTLAYEANERAETDYGIEHPNVAPDGTSMKPTDQNGVATCLQCHKPASTTAERGIGAPITLRDIVHPAHMFSTTFKEHYGGNCFTCHNVRSDGGFELLGDKVDTNEKGVPKALLKGQGAIPGAVQPSEGTR